MPLNEKLNLFIENTNALRREFVWHSMMTKRLVALLYTQENMPVDINAIKNCHDLIKQNTGPFSTFRGNMTLCISSLLSLSENPHEMLNETLKVYDLLKKAKFSPSDYLVIAAFEIANQVEENKYDDIVKRTRAFFEGMRSNRIFTTGQDDYIFAAMLGLSDLDVNVTTDRIERVNTRLRVEFNDKNSVQALSQVLVLGGSDENILFCILKLRDALRAKKIRLDKSYTLTALGILTLLQADVESIVRDIDDVQTRLRTQKGFGAFSVSTQELLLYTTAIVAGVYADDIEAGLITASLSTSITNIIIAQQVAMIAAITASSAAVAAASS